ncbi:hypothetical protein J2W33_005190 [Variovorax boronicumulans]|nr:hypothetical protein [Variovorax boronicumulans]
MLAQFLQFGGHAMRRQVGRAGDQFAVAREDSPDHVSGVLQGSAAKCDIDAIGDQIDEEIAEHEVQAHKWMLGQKLLDPFHLEKTEEAGWCSNAHHAAGLRVVRRMQLIGVDEFLDCRSASLMEGFTRARQRELAGRALYQPRAQPRFELLDAPAQRGGRHAQPSCRLGKAAAAIHLYEHCNFIQIKHEDSFFVVAGIEAAFVDTSST